MSPGPLEYVQGCDPGTVLWRTQAEDLRAWQQTLICGVLLLCFQNLGGPVFFAAFRWQHPNVRAFPDLNKNIRGKFRNKAMRRVGPAADSIEQKALW